MQMTLDLSRQETFVRLGAVVLPVSSYEMMLSVPVVRKTCADGKPYTRLLEEIPCTLTLSGTMLRAEAGHAAGLLQDALAAHTEYAFSLDDMCYQHMQPTEIQLTGSGNAHTAKYRITMIGGMCRADSL